MAQPQESYRQEPIAIVGFACRLPGGSNTPHKLWELLDSGKIASNKVPESRFNIKAFHDGSLKPGTMRPPGGMFIEDVDLATFDAPFFEISRAEAISMDPNQRQMLEVVYEGLENAGITLEQLNGASVGCFAASYASDYMDMQNRDPLDRPEQIVVGGGRAILANRLSHFLNIKGPSMTIDTACSGSLVGLDVAARYLKTGEIDAAIIAASNLYLSPEHVMDRGGVGAAHSISGFCHTFDIAADGYVKAEAVSTLIIKRLDDAVRCGDPIRAIIRGSSTNSDGRTAGIANPSAEAQEAAIRAAYANAGIENFNETGYLECHGTGTQAGDPAEVGGVAAVFSATRTDPLIIGSVKSNIGHSEPGAGISGLLKATMAIEKGIIPGNPTFINPNPKIDFSGWKIKASRRSLRWPALPIRRASINSFGYGGSNSHVVLEEYSGSHHKSSYIGEDDDFFPDEEESLRPFTLVFSANDEQSLKENFRALSSHLVNPKVRVSLGDLAYTLSERRTQHFHRGYIVTKSLDLDENHLVVGKKKPEKPRIGFIFTGQGAQWPQMGRDLIEAFPLAHQVLSELDSVLQSLPDAPTWSLLGELTEPRTAEHLRQPEFSQPLVTALQISLLSILEDCGIQPQSVAGHSSGEIAAAYAAGLLSKADAIKSAFYRGRAALNCAEDASVGMLAVGLGEEALEPYLAKHDSAWIACYNSPSSLTVSGKLEALEALKDELQAENHFARMLQVDLAYHSPLMSKIGVEYKRLLDRDFKPLAGSKVSMFSSVTGSKKSDAADSEYWKKNMVSAVRFDAAVKEMISGPDDANFLIEIGPNGALAGPIAQIKKELANGSDVSYCTSWSRGADAIRSLYDCAGRLFVAGGSVSMAKLNRYESPAVLIDLPNYSWNHAVRYWHENDASRDWRFKNFVHHDLLGSKIMGTPWQAPSFRRLLTLEDVPWLRDHKVGADVVLPGAGYVAMAVEAMYQKKQSLEAEHDRKANDMCYRLRNIRFDKALVVEEQKAVNILLALTPQPGTEWNEFSVTSSADNLTMEHCTGLIRVEDPIATANKEIIRPLEHPVSGQLWYKAHTDAGYGFGPAFQKIQHVESRSGDRSCRTVVSLAPPPSKWDPQSAYPIHPASLDGCVQTVTASLWAGERSMMDRVLVPSIIDEVVVNKVSSVIGDAISTAETKYSGRGRREDPASYFSDTKLYDAESGEFLMHISGMHYATLDAGTTKSDEFHTFEQVSWKPDVSFLTQDQLTHLHVGEDKINILIDLVAHKKPALRVLDVSLDAVDSSLWFDGEDVATRSAYVECILASTDAKSLIALQNKYEHNRDTSFGLVNVSKEGLGIDTENCDLAIVRLGASAEHPASIVENVRPLLAEGGRVLLIPGQVSIAESESDSSETKDDWQAKTPNGRASPSTETDYSDLGIEEEKPEISLDEKDFSESQWGAPTLEDHMTANGLSSTLTASTDIDNTLAILAVNEPEHETVQRILFAARLSKHTPPMTSALKKILEASGWDITEQKPFAEAPAQCTILVLDELSAPVLTGIDSTQFEYLKTLLASGNNVLWVTRGSQYDVTHPDSALVHGLFRTIRMEDPNQKLTTLDVQSATSPAAAVAIDLVLKSLQSVHPKHFGEFEYAERDGLIYVHRLLPDVPINDFRAEERDGAKPARMLLRDSKAKISLRAERKGTLNSLHYCEAAETEVPAGQIEVEVMAAGANFKDVAVTMGIVPENEFTPGLEGSGIVKRLGRGVDQFRVGERVCFLHNGSFANRTHVPVGRAHGIPDSLSFDNAATMPLVFLTAIYSLRNIAKIQKGQSVLIHSAAGGLGIACIQYCQHIGAEIYATAGSPEKRKFLADTFGIPLDHLANSRDNSFAKAILAVSNGRGVDVIVNSLTGDLLDESWRLTADGGTMLELGKKDIVSRNRLSMEPFDRNCSFRAVDFSFTKDISDKLIADLLTSTFTLLREGHIKPIYPITKYAFDEIPSALAYIRGGKHIGKIVISGADMEVPVRPVVRPLALRPDASYVIIGGLKGLCGNLAVHMAIHGARNIIVVSRSGLQDDASQKIVLNCAARGCKVVDGQGDVTDYDVMHDIFKRASPPVAGVIQGAMILRDKPFENMTLEEYHLTIGGKIKGTWNLHRISVEQNLLLDFFTMLSSISGIIGKKGQSNYAAANTFLDAFATYRRSLGLCAHAVDLGLIEDVGYIAEQGGMDSHFDKTQWIPILEGTLRKILTYSIFQQTATPLNRASAGQLVTGIAFPLPDHSDLKRDARFGYQFAHSASSGGGKDADQPGDQSLRAFRLMQRSGVAPAELSRAAVEVLGAQFARILRLETEMEPAKPLMAYGLDSLAAVEVRNWVRMELGAELSTLDVTNASSLIALCDKLVAKLPALAPGDST